MKENSTSIEEGNKKWLDAYYDPLAGIYSFSQCITLSNVAADGDHKLVIGDLGNGKFNMKLRIYKGTTLEAENNLRELPTGVVTFYGDMNEPRVPSIAVASGPCLYMFKSLKPFYKFTLPTLKVDPREQELWDQSKSGKLNNEDLQKSLETLRNECSSLTGLSQQILLCKSDKLDSMIATAKDRPLVRNTSITCIATLKKSVDTYDSLACLVIGTEDCSIFVIDPQAFTVLATMDLSSVPVFISISGLFDVEYRILVSCRNGAIYQLQRGNKTGKLVVQLNSQPIGLCKMNKNLLVSCMDNSVQSFTLKGKKLWQHKLDAMPTAMAHMHHRQQNFEAVLVALSNATVQIYRDKYHVSTFSTREPIIAMHFGRFGREDATLIMLTRGGGLMVKMFKRTATLDEKSITRGPPAAQNTKLNVPKKTQLFVDQTLRERENSIGMHQQFQKDLYKLRLETARNYVKTIQMSMTPVSTNEEAPLKLTAQVHGIGPSFKLSIYLSNTSHQVLVYNYMIVFQYDTKIYSIEKKCIQLPLLVPAVNYIFETLVENISSRGISDIIKVIVIKRNETAPALIAAISMPTSEGLEE